MVQFLGTYTAFSRLTLIWHTSSRQLTWDLWWGPWWCVECATVCACRGGSSRLATFRWCRDSECHGRLRGVPAQTASRPLATWWPACGSDVWRGVATLNRSSTDCPGTRPGPSARTATHSAAFVKFQQGESRVFGHSGHNDTMLHRNYFKGSSEELKLIPIAVLYTMQGVNHFS